MTLNGGFKVLSREGEQIPAIGLTITMKNSGKNTQDAYSLFEYSVPAGVNGPPVHTHTREDESFVCLAGKMDVTLGGEEFTIGFGDYLYLPRNVPHAFRNPYDEESRVISVVSPAGLEAYYQALSEMPPGPMDFAKVKAIMDDFGIEMDLPPGH
ncbi:MAG: cupin domain-containing protein [Nocardioides sp.]